MEETKVKKPRLIWLSEQNAGTLLDGAIVRAHRLLDQGAAENENLVEVKSIYIAATAAIITGCSVDFYNKYNGPIIELGERIERESIKPRQNEIQSFPEENCREGY